MNDVVQVKIPAKLIPVFTGEADVRAAYGSRGSAKTQTFAKMSAIRGYMWAKAGKTGIILCGRQFMASLDDSSLAEVKAAIKSEPWLLEHYDIGEKYIRTRDGRIEYKFAGLDINIDSVKSKAKILLCWVDEAEPVTEEAWGTLIPTLRDEESELWVTWNPKRKSSPADVRFRQFKNDRVKVAEMNWRDNEWFPDKLNRTRLLDLDERPDTYDHIWEGAYVTVIAGAYYAKSLTQARAEGRIGRVSADPLMTIRLFADIGGTGAKADAFTLWAAQFIGKEVRVVDYYEVVGQPLAAHLAWMRERGYTPERAQIWLPHDGKTHDRVYDVSYESALGEAGYTVNIVPNQGKGAAKARIEAGRRLFPAIWFDADKCAGGLDALGWYHEKMDETRNLGLGPEHDFSSHGCLDGDSIISTARGLIAIRDVVVGDMVETPVGFAHVSASGITKIATEMIEMTLEDGSMLLMTPEHKVFTTRGVVTADTLRYDDAIFTMESAPCLSFQSIKSVGYRDALIESFRVRDTGFGLVGVFTQARSAVCSASYILRSIAQCMVSRIPRLKLNTSMGICAIPTPTTGSSSDQSGRAFTLFKRSTGFVSTLSQKDTTRQATTNMAGSLCTAMFGKSTMATFRTGCTFTTLTATSQTTALIILRCLQLVSISSTTLSQASGLIAQRISCKLSLLVNWLKHGIQAQRVWRGTPKTERGHGTNERQLRSNAAFAAKIMKPSSRKNHCSAIQIAKIRTFNGDTARRPVYDLTVDHHHCYIANGVLVSNSDSFGMLCVVHEEQRVRVPKEKSKLDLYLKKVRRGRVSAMAA